jgi:hypothetical protein
VVAPTVLRLESKRGGPGVGQPRLGPGEHWFGQLDEGAALA